MTEQRPPHVFISYSHDTVEHQERVLGLADRLRADGIDAEVDQYNAAPSDGWPLWCERQIKAADVVLMVCTETYNRRVSGDEEHDKGLGAVWEAGIIRQLLYDAGVVSGKFVPVLFSDVSPEQIPTPIKGWTRYIVDTENGYEELYRRLTGQPHLLRPALGTIRSMPTRRREWSQNSMEAASSSREMAEGRGRLEPVSGSQETDVSRLDFPAVSAQPLQGLNNLVAAVHMYDAPLIFLGFHDKHVLRAILSELKSKGRGALYITPGVLTSLINLIDRGEELPARMVYVTDCPRESCTVFGYDGDRNLSCIIFRYLPRLTMVWQDSWWSTTLSPGSSYPEYLYNTYDRHYRRGAMLLTSSLQIRLLYGVHQRRIWQNRQLIANHLSISTRPLAYLYAATVLRQAQYSILSVDFMSPRLWTRTDGFIHDYIQAHKRDSLSVMSRIRIHGYSEASLAKDTAAYTDFLSIHKDINVELFFIEARLIRQTGIQRGFVVIDEQMVFLVEDLAFVANQDSFTLEDLENVQDLLECGFFDFTMEGVAKHIELFRRLQRKYKNMLLSAEDFERKLPPETGVSVSGLSESSAEPT